MPRIYQLWHSLTVLLRRRKAEKELQEELRDHFEQEVRSNQRKGMDEQEAREEAARLIGSIAIYQEECREQWGTGWSDRLRRDVRYGLRTFLRTPIFTGMAILTLGLGIGANTTIFTFLEGYVLRGLPVGEPQRLYSVNWGDEVNISYPNYSDLRDRNSTFDQFMACRLNPPNVSLGARGNFLSWGYEATGNYFGGLKLRPLLGRFFGPAEDNQPNAHPVAVISAQFWRTRFGSDIGVIGKTMKINGFPFTVIGVAPPEFRGTELIVTADYWVPMMMAREAEPGSNWLQSRSAGNIWVLGVYDRGSIPGEQKRTWGT